MRPIIRLLVFKSRDFLEKFTPNKSTVKNSKRANCGRFVFLCFKLPPCCLSGEENRILSPRLQHTRLLLPHLKAPGLVSGYSTLNVVYYFRVNRLVSTAKLKSFNAFLTENLYEKNWNCWGFCPAMRFELTSSDFVVWHFAFKLHREASVGSSVDQAPDNHLSFYRQIIS